MQDFFCTEPDEMRYKVLAERARLFKKTEKGVRAMSGVLEEMREEVQKKAAERTAIKAAQEFALKSVKEGKFTEEEAKEFFSLSDDDVRTILKTEK